MRDRSPSYISAHNDARHALIIQHSVLVNRFMINLKSLSAAGSSQGSSARHWSRFSAPNFHIPDSLLGNIGEDLQGDYEPADDNLDGDQEMGAASLSIQVSQEAELQETNAKPGPPSSSPENARVSAHSLLRTKTKRDNIVLLRPVP